MKIIHRWQKNILEQSTSQKAGFLLTDQKGGWFSLWSQPLSRYQGWFVQLNQRHYRVLEDIRLLDGAVLELQNNFWSQERKVGENQESFWLAGHRQVLVYELSQPGRAEITVDFKEPYDNQKEATYELWEEEGLLVVKCLLGVESLFLAVKSDSGRFFSINQRMTRYYELDASRNSPPFERSVLRAFQLEGQKMVLAVASTLEQAKKEALLVFNNLSRFKQAEQKRIAGELEHSKLAKAPSDIQMAYRACRHSLTSLFFEQTDGAGFYAGLPWFFQAWSRDALISLKSAWLVNPLMAANVFGQILNCLKTNGVLPKIFNGPSEFSVGTGDGLGWLAKRTEDFWSVGYF